MRAVCRALFAAAVLAVLAVTIPASAAAGHSAGHAAHRCNFANDHWTAQWGTKNLGTIDYVWGEWTANPCAQKLETRAYCHSLVLGTNYRTYSGQVKSAGLKAEADCRLDDQLLIADIRFTRADGSWMPWRNLCAPCGRAAPREGQA